MKIEKAMVSRNTKLKLIDSYICSSIKLELTSSYDNPKDVDIIKERIKFNYNGKEYFSVCKENEEMYKTISLVDKLKEDILLELTDYGDDGISLEYFILLKQGEALINCEQDMGFTFYKKFFCTIEKYDHVVKLDQYDIMKYDEVGLSNIKIYNKLINNLQDEKQKIFSNMLLFDYSDKEEDGSNIKKLYGKRDNVIFTDLKLRG